MTQDAASRAAGRLARIIPEHKVIATFIWIHKEWMPMNPRFREIREKAGDPKDSHKCWWCKTKFADGDIMALAAQAGKGNVLLCGNCATKALKAVEGERK